MKAETAPAAAAMLQNKVTAVSQIYYMVVENPAIWTRGRHLIESFTGLFAAVWVVIGKWRQSACPPGESDNPNVVDEYHGASCNS